MNPVLGPDLTYGARDYLFGQPGNAPGDPVLGPPMPKKARGQLYGWAGNPTRDLGPALTQGAKEELFGRKGNAGRRLGPDLPGGAATLAPDELGPALTPGARDELFGRKGNAGKVLGPEIPPVLGPDLTPEVAESIFGKPGNVPASDLIPGVGARVGNKNPQRLGLGPRDPGLPGLGAEASGPAELTDLLAPAEAPEGFTDLLGPVDTPISRRRGSSPVAQARATRDILGAEKLPGWENLANDEIETLVSWAYPNDEAISNAYLKYRDPADLAARAFERIGQLPRESFDQFVKSHPDLARKVAELPALGEQNLSRQLADEDLLRAQELETIKDSPYAAVFEYFDDQGRLKRNPMTGRNIPPSKREDLGEVLGRYGFGLDEIAGTILSGYYGDPDSRIAAGIRDDEFWSGAKEKFLRMKELTAKPPVDELGFTPQGEYVGKGRGKDNLGLLPGAPSRGRMTLQTAGLGGLGGYAAGEDEDPEDERNAAAFGTLVGGLIGGAAGSKFGRTSARLVPALWRNGIRAQREALASGKGASLSDVGRIWKTQTTSTIRNLLQDEMVSRLWLARAGVEQGVMNDNWYSMVDLYQRGMRDPYEAMPERSRQMLDLIGKGPKMGPAPTGAKGPLAAKTGASGYIPNIGASLSEENDKLVKALHPLTTMGIEAGLSVMSPLNAVPGLGVALGGAKGLARPMWTEIFQSINSFTHAAARHAVFQESMVDDLAEAGTGFINRDPRLARLPADGMFSPDEVLNLTGSQNLADEWAGQVDGAIANGEKRAKEVFGDFSNERWWERGLGMAVPFASWGLRAYPRTIGMLAEHPGITYALLAWTKRDAERAKAEGRPGYQVGNVTLNKDTPALGKILGGMTAGKEGDLRVNLLGALSPFSGEAFAAPDDEGEDQTTYQKIKGQVAKTGFSFNPFIVGLAYALNWDYMRPGALSRTAGIEQSMPGPEIPSFMQGPLDFIRGANGGNVSQVTPEERRLGQNVYDETGYALNSPQNAGIAASSNLPGDARMEQAKKDVGQGGLVKNLVSLLSPVSMTAETDTARFARQSAGYQRQEEAQRAEAGLPSMRTDPATMTSIRQANPLLAILLEERDRAQGGEAAQINRGVDKESRAFAALEAWEREHAALQYFQPSVYRTQKAQLRQALGIPPER